MKKRIPFFSVLAEAQTYLNIVYILVAFPLSIVYFSLLISGIFLSAGLLIIAVGFFIFLGTLLMIRGFRWLDLQLTKVFLGKTIRYTKDNSAEEKKFSAFLKGLLGSSSTWKGFVHYLFVKFPLDCIIWTVTITFIAITFSLLLAPVLHQYTWYDEEISQWLIDFFDEVYVLPFLGIIWGMISLHVIRGLAWVSREVNQALLGN